MIRIKAVDSENILEVCELTTKQDGIRAIAEGRSYHALRRSKHHGRF